MVGQKKGAKASTMPNAFIAVFGVTGAGKSTFVQTVTQDGSVVVGHDLESCE
jgi:signal recognition particle receptor subunit beta